MPLPTYHPHLLQDGTPAAELPDQVPPATRQRRRDELVSLQQRISEGFAESLVGRTLEVLVDAVGEDGGFIGRTQWDAPDGEHLGSVHGTLGVWSLLVTVAKATHTPSHFAWAPTHPPPTATAPPPPPPVDPIVFMAEAEDPAVPRLELGQVRLCRVDGASIFDLDATVIH